LPAIVSPFLGHQSSLAGGPVFGVHYTCYRRISDGQILEGGLKNYLVLLSIFQTCKYKGISFLKFLLSREEDVGTYCERRRARNDSAAIEVYPDGFSRKHRKLGRDEGIKDGEG
jgi:hypothetical protein